MAPKLKATSVLGTALEPPDSSDDHPRTRPFHRLEAQIRYLEYEQLDLNKAELRVRREIALKKHELRRLLRALELQRIPSKEEARTARNRRYKLYALLCSMLCFGCTAIYACVLNGQDECRRFYGGIILHLCFWVPITLIMEVVARALGFR
ncbi:hypothetical protein LTR56_023993 [Elasticomyces elasticus]|nr:hypothetical protein LTR56_023993 [Elasticomyces elasticus]